MPLGAGSNAVRVYVTVLVTTCLTLTGRETPDCGGSMKLLVLPSIYQLVGEYGDLRTALLGVALAGVVELLIALFGEAQVELYGESGIRSFLKDVGVLLPEGFRETGGRTNGVGGIRGADVATRGVDATGSFRDSPQVQEHALDG